MNPDVVIVLTAILVATAGSLLGVFLVLRRMSMLSDAISHAILPGIVAAFWLTGGETSTVPALFGAAAAGLLTVVTVEYLTRTGRVKSDAAIGLVFPLFFAVGVILISLYFRNVHLDLDAVLYGEIAYAPLNTVTAFGRDVPESLLLMGALAALNAVFVALFYKELKLATFDAGLAAALGFAPGVLHYALMTLLSFTTVGAFQSVGAILIVAFVIIPPASAYLLTRRLPVMLTLSIAFGVVASVAGYVLALALDASIAGMIAAVLGTVFVACLLFSPVDGVLATLGRQRRQRGQFAARQLIAQLGDAGLNGARTRLGWTDAHLQQAIRAAQAMGWLTRTPEPMLTPDGAQAAQQHP